MGRVERGRRGCRRRGGASASFRAEPQYQPPYPVSRERSSNRTCGFPAYGFRTGCHVETCGVRARWWAARQTRPPGPKTTSGGNRRVPCPGTLCRCVSKTRAAEDECVHPPIRPGDCPIDPSVVPRRPTPGLRQTVRMGQNVHPPNLVVEAVEPIRRLLLGLDAQLPLEDPDRIRGG